MRKLIREDSDKNINCRDAYFAKLSKRCGSFIMRIAAYVFISRLAVFGDVINQLFAVGPA